MTLEKDLAMAQSIGGTPSGLTNRAISDTHPWTLNRFHITEAGILGELLIPNFHTEIYTIERPWRGNERFVSCIPEGLYPLNSHQGTRWPHAISVNNVPNRSGILIHPAFRVSHVKGCIGVGLGWGIRENEDDTHTPFLSAHTAAFDVLMKFWDELIKSQPIQQLLVTGPAGYGPARVVQGVVLKPKTTPSI